MDSGFNGIEKFMTSFNKMFTETKYNLQALNQRFESMGKCFNNILLLNTNKPFDEVNPDELLNSSSSIKQKSPKKKKQNTKKNKNKITSIDLDEIEKTLKNIDEPQKQNNTFINKKRNKTSTKKNKDISEMIHNIKKDKEKNINESESSYSSYGDSGGVDYYVPGKNDNYTKFKEIKNKMKNNEKKDEYYDDEDDDDDFISDV